MADYIPLWLDWLEVTEPLNAVEKGRLIDALVAYARGEDVQDRIVGNEKFLFPMFKGQLDRHLEYLEEKRTNGAKGGRPRKDSEVTDGFPEKPDKTMVTGGFQNGDVVSGGFSEKPINNKNNSKSESKNENENENENDNGVTRKARTRATRARREPFTPPTVEQVAAYCTEKGYNVDAERFIAHYQSNGWHVGKTPMVDWQAAVRTWTRNGYGSTAHGGSGLARPNPAQNYEQRNYSGDEANDVFMDLSEYERPPSADQ